MWYRVILFTLLLSAAMFAQPSSYLLGPETFDTGIPSSWTVIDGGPAGTWYWWSNLARIDGSVSGYQDDWLISPAFDGTAAADSIILHFWHQVYHYPTEAGSCYALISVDGGLTYPETVFVMGPSSGTLAETVEVRIDNLGTPLTGNCKVAFKYGFYNSNYWYIDYVYVGLYISEPAPPTFDHISYYHRIFPMTATSYPETVYIDDVTGVSPSSAQLCYDVNTGGGYSGTYTCIPLSTVSVDGNGRGTYTAEIPAMGPWDSAKYYFLAQDTYVPPSMGLSDTFEMFVQGPYYAYDNTDIYPETPDNVFRDITTVGTDLGISSDDSRASIALPFIFRYYGYDYNTIWVCTNGWASFGLDPGTNDYSNDNIPYTSSPNALIALWWDDLTMSDGNIYYYTSADGDTFIVEYYNAREIGGTTHYNVEFMLINPAICDEVAGNGEVIFKYETMDATGLDDATIGVENEDGTLGTEYLYDGTYGTGVEIVGGAAPINPGPSALKFTPNPPPGGVIRGHVTLTGETDHSGVLVSALGPGGNYDYTDATGYFLIEVSAGTYDVAAYKDYHWTTDTVYGITVAVDETVDVDFTLNHLPFATIFNYDFEGSDGGFTVSGGGWEWGVPTSGPGAAHSGTHLWATVLDGNYENSADYILMTPEIDLSYFDPPIYLSFWHWYEIEDYWDDGYLDISTDGGMSWTNLVSYTGYDMTWRNETIDLSAYAGDTIIIRWYLDSDGSVNYSGWYLDDVVLEGMLNHFGVIKGTVMLYGEADYSGVLVSADGPMYQTITTPSDGYYEFILAPGSYDIAAYNGPAWETDTVLDVTISEGETTVVNFTLHKIPVGYIVGYADLTDTPGPDAGINCELFSELAPTTTTDATGRYFFDNVYAGTYAVAANFAGYGPGASVLFDVVPGETTYVDTIFLNREPYTYDFESDDGGFTVVGGGWEWGTPTAGPPSAHSGTNCWGTDLDDYYVDYADWQLIIDVTSFSASLSSMGYYGWYDFEDGYDGGNISVSTDGGFTWTILYPADGYDDVISTWFGSPIAGEPAFTDASGGWLYEEVDLTVYAGTATHIRFRLGADESASYYYGWYVDDVVFSTLLPPTGCVEGYVYDATTYSVLPGAMVVCEGETTYADEYGHFILCGVPVGYNQVFGSADGYVANYIEVPVGQDTTGGLFIPLMPWDFDPEYDPGVYADLVYGNADTTFLTICNPYDQPIEVSIGGAFDTGGGLMRTTPDDINISKLVGTKLKNFSKEQVVERLSKGRINNLDYSLSRDGLMRTMATTAYGDVVDSIDLVVPSIDIPWGFGCVGMFTEWSYWVSTVFTYSPSQNVEFGLDKVPSGVAWRTLWAGSWPGDMTYDGTIIWQVNVGGDNGLYGWSPATGEVIDTISDPDGIWDANSQRGVAYDAAEDVFYIGGWNDNIVYKIKGKSWDNPGEIITAWSLNDVAGIGFNHSRRTVIVALNNASDDVVEFDPYTSTILNVYSFGWMGGFSLAGAEVDADGKLWVVSMNQNKAYAIDIPGGDIPPGIGIGPSSFTIPANACTTIIVYTGGVNSPGTYSFDIPITFEGGNTIYFPATIVISPALNKGWNLVSFPVNATPNNIYVQLSDDIVPFSNEPPNSQIYAWDAEHGTYTTPEIFERGRGYYLYSWYDAATFDVIGAPYYTSFTMTLPYYSTSLAGWNLVGNPVNTKIDWDVITADPSFFGIYPIYYYLTEFGWATYSPGFPAGTGRYISPYMGFYVLVQPGAIGVLPVTTSGIVPMLAREMTSSTTSDIPDFTLRFSVQNGTQIDMWNYLATRPSASDGFDYYYDAPEPPTPPSGADMAKFWCDGQYLLRDVKRSMSDGDVKVWSVKITGATSGTDVVISWPLEHTPDGEDASQGMNQIYEGYDFDLYDPVADEHINMRTTDHYSFAYYGMRTLYITVSATYLETEEGNSKVPAVVSLGQNVPNPFNSSTEISFNLPADADVTLDVFDLNGKKVKTLADGRFSAGAHTIAWNGKDDSGKDVPGGVYFYKLSTDSATRTRRMVLVK
ncbi:choice-of-anchor J domain-containing protein [bacterium]|nr:choice-of-anchor J domain-containing protein [bacterium]